MQCTMEEIQMDCKCKWIVNLFESSTLDTNPRQTCALHGKITSPNPIESIISYIFRWEFAVCLECESYI